MADIFSTDDARRLFKDKFIFMLGDSNMRATYKDLVFLICRNKLVTLPSLRKRGEDSYEGDQRIVQSAMSRGRKYLEGREYVKRDLGLHIEYHFITRCYTEQIVCFLEKIKKKEMKRPDVFIMNSCIWDITRWGPNGVDTFKDNMKKLMLKLNECLPKETLFIWTTTLPVSTVVRGGLLIKQIDFMQPMLRFEVMEANVFCRQLVVSHGYDVLDTHYHLRMQIHRRLKDGIHYGPLPARFISNLLLTHISLSWEVPLPGNSHGIALDRMKSATASISTGKQITLPIVPDCLKNDENHNKNKKTEHEQSTPSRNGAKSGRQFNFNRGQSGHYRNKGAHYNKNNFPQMFDYYRGTQHHPNMRDNYNHNQDYWIDTFNDQRSGRNNQFNQYQRNQYADFDKVGGPVRKNNKYPKNRSRPY